jgi:hypothetical protein
MIYKLHIRNPDVESYRLAYKRVNSEGSIGGWTFGGLGNFWGGLQIFSGPLPANINIFWISQLKPSRLAPLLGDLIKGGVWVLGHRNA